MNSGLTFFRLLVAVRSVLKRFRHLCSPTALVVIASAMVPLAGNAQTVRLVADIDKAPASIEVKAFQSNGRVGMFYKNGFFRASRSDIRPIDLPVPARLFESFATTRNSFYFRSKANGKTNLWRISADGERYKVVARNLDGVISRALIHPRTGDVYFGQYTPGPASNPGRFRIYRIDPARHTLKSLGWVKGQCSNNCFENIAISNEKIFFVMIRPNYDQAHRADGGELWTFDLRTRRTQLLDVWLYPASQTFSVANNLLYFTRNLHVHIDAPVDGLLDSCAVGRSDGTKAGTFLLTDGAPQYGNTGYLDHWPQIRAGCYLDVQARSNRSAVFQRLAGRVDNPDQILAMEIWTTNGTRSSTRSRAKVLEGAELSPYHREFGGCRSTNAMGLACDLHLKVVDNYVWYSNILYSPSDSTLAKQRVSVLDLWTGNVFTVIEGNYNERIQYESIGDQMLITKQQIRVVDDSGITSGREDTEVIGTAILKARVNGRGLSELINKPELTVIGDVSNWLYVATDSGLERKMNTLAIDLRTGNTVEGPSLTTKSNRSGLTRVDGLHVTDDAAYFCAGNAPLPSNRVESLWKNNSGENGVSRIINQLGQSVQGQTNREACRDIQISDDTVYYTRFTADTGLELWQSELDGTNQRILVDLTAGPDSSSIEHLNLVGDKLVMTASINGEPVKWIAVDPTGGTEVLSDKATAARVVGKSANRLIYLVEDDRNDSYFDDLWTTDGTASGTQKLTTGWASLMSNVLITSDTSAYLYGEIEPENVEPEFNTGLHKLEFGTNRFESTLISFNIPTPTPRSMWVEPSWMVEHKGSIYVLATRDIYFTGRISNFPSEVYRVDLSNGSTTSVVRTPGSAAGASIQATIRSMISWRNHLYFFLSTESSRNGKISGGWQLWRSNGTRGSARRIYSQTGVVPFTSFNHRMLQASSNTLWMVAERRGRGTELWRVTP